MRAALPEVGEPDAVRRERLFRRRFGLALAPDERPRRRPVDRVGRRAARDARPVVVEFERALEGVLARGIGPQRQHGHRRHVRLVEAQLVGHIQRRQRGLREHLGQHLVGFLARDAHRPVLAEVRGPPEPAGRLERRHGVRGDHEPAAENQRRLVQCEARVPAHERARQRVGRVGRIGIRHDLHPERPRPRVPRERVIRLRPVRRVEECAARFAQRREDRRVERPGNRQRLLPVSERAAAARGRVASEARPARVDRPWPGPRLAVAGIRLIPAVVRALGRGGQQGHQVSIGLVGHAHDVGRRERQRLRGGPSAIDHHRALGRLDGFRRGVRRLAVRRPLSRGGVHHQHSGRLRGGRIENEDELRAWRRDGVQLARGAARDGRARQELLAEFREPVHCRLRRLRHRVGLFPRLARGRPRRRGRGHPDASSVRALRQELRTASSPASITSASKSES